MKSVMISKKPLFLSLAAFLTTLLILLHKANSTETVAFSFSEFTKENSNDLNLEGDASIIVSKKVLQLTQVDSNGMPLKYRTGRVLYPEPLHLYDPSSGVEAGFTTSFVFRVTSPGTSPNDPADGLTFFIASPNYPRGTSGGNLGLFGGSTSSNDKVVAIEFDTYSNSDIPDPDYKHIGVDVNSKVSKKTEKWEWVNGDGVQVTISYEPYGKLLRVIANNFSGSRVEFTYDIDLADILPEWVEVGFTGATGGATQVTYIENWSFYSVLGHKRNYFADSAHLASVV